MWENWSPEEAQADADADGDGAVANGSSAHTAAGAENLKVTVTEVTDTNEFFVQPVDEPRVEWVVEQLRQMAVTDGPVATGLVQGSLCLGQFSLDKSW